MKKLSKLLLVVAVVFGFGILISNAVTPTTISITGASDKHRYEAYQVFKGKLSKVPGKPEQMVDIDWGDGIDSEKLLDELNKKVTGKNFTTPQSVADWLDKEVNNTEDDNATAQLFASIVADCLKAEGKATSEFKTNHHEIKLADEGYYFIKDVSSLAGQDESYTRYLLKVFGVDTTIQVKADEATMTKKVKNGSNYADSTIAEITDIITFRLTASLPTTFGDYNTYKLVFKDKMSAGLTYGDYKVYLVNGATETELTGTNKLFSQSVEGDKIVFSADNIKTIQGITENSKIVIEYTATLNDSAVVGANTNEATLDYSNNPNETVNSATGTTVKDTATVYTYKLDITKVDGRSESTKLPGVKFKLCKDADGTTCAKFTGTSGSYVFAGWTTGSEVATEIVTDENGAITAKGLKTTTYYLLETETIQGYNLLKEAETVEVTENSSCTKSLTVKNYKGSLLPSTGGIGTVIFYVCGLLLIGGVIYFVIASKKKEEK